MKPSKPLKILQILPALNYCGGMENYVMNYYRHIDKTKIQFDFITHTDLEASYEEEINSFGGKVYKFPVFSIKKLKVILQMIEEFFKIHGEEYAAIHCHMANAAYFYFNIAKKFGIRNRILHSHQPAAADSLSHKIRNYPLLYLGNKLATHRIACTDLAGRFLFGHNRYTVIRNAIDIRKFDFNADVRKRMREEYQLTEKTVIGHIGRFCPVKNQLFLIDIFREIHLQDLNTVLVLIGAGADKEAICSKLHKLNLWDSTILIDPTSDVDQWYQAFDYFVFPSLYEGLGIVLVEAQCAGLPVFVSKENIPPDVKMSDHLEFISIKEPAAVWCKRILAKQMRRSSGIQAVRQGGYDITTEAFKLEKYYLELLNDSGENRGFRNR